jgi:hypothetical protein
MRKEIYHVLSTDKQRASLAGFKDNYRLYGTVVSGGSSKKGHFVGFDVFPAEHKKVQVARRRLTVLAEGE